MPQTPPYNELLHVSSPKNHRDSKTERDNGLHVDGVDELERSDIHPE